MIRIQPIPYQSATGKAKTLLDAVNVKLGMVPNMFRTLAHSPAVLDGYLKLSGALTGGKLSAGLREQLALVSAAVNGCDYCASAHTAIGRTLGLSEQALVSARQGRSADAKTEVALRFARSILLARGQIGLAEFQAVREAGFDEGEIAEVIAHVGLNTFTNYFNLIAGTEIDFPLVRLAETA